MASSQLEGAQAPIGRGWARALRGACLALLVSVSPTWAAKPPDGLAEAQQAYAQQQFDRVVNITEPWAKEAGPEVWRLRVQAFAKLGRPREAMPDYERLIEKLGQEDEVLLRELAFAAIVSVLKDMREQMRGAGYTALKELQSDEALPYLLDGLSDGSGLIRVLAVEGLGHIKSGVKHPRLAKALDDQAAMVRIAALRAMGRSGQLTMIPLAEKALKDEQNTVRIAAAGALFRLGRKEAWGRVSEAAHAPIPEDRAAALRLLGELGDRRALPILLQAMNDVQPSLRGAAATGLGSIGGPEAEEALRHALEDTLPPVRATAAVALGDLKGTHSVDALRARLSDPNPAVRAAVIDALLRLNVPLEQMADTVRGLANNSDPGMRASIGRALGKAEEGNLEGGIGWLKGLAMDPLPRPKIAAVRSLGQAGAHAHEKRQRTEIIEILRFLIKDEDAAVRATVGGALGKVLGFPGSSSKAVGD